MNVWANPKPKWSFGGMHGMVCILGNSFWSCKVPSIRIEGPKTVNNFKLVCCPSLNFLKLWTKYIAVFSGYQTELHEELESTRAKYLTLILTATCKASLKNSKIFFCLFWFSRELCTDQQSWLTNQNPDYIFESYRTPEINNFSVGIIKLLGGNP